MVWFLMFLKAMLDVLNIVVWGLQDNGGFLLEKSVIMADRGFKSTDAILSKKNCTLYRPPSVSSTANSSTEDVILTKRIASLRIHVERAIRRIREYALLSPHSTLHHSIMPIIDNIVIIAAVLVNIQEPIIKT